MVMSILKSHKEIRRSVLVCWQIRLLTGLIRRGVCMCYV